MKSFEHRQKTPRNCNRVRELMLITGYIHGTHTQNIDWERSGQCGLDFRWGKRNFSVCRRIEKGCVPAILSSRHGTVPGSKKQPDREADSSPPSTPQVNNLVPVGYGCLCDAVSSSTCFSCPAEMAI